MSLKLERNASLYLPWDIRVYYSNTNYIYYDTTQHMYFLFSTTTRLILIVSKPIKVVVVVIFVAVLLKTSTTRSNKLRPNTFWRKWNCRTLGLVLRLRVEFVLPLSKEQQEREQKEEQPLTKIYQKGVY